MFDKHLNHDMEESCTCHGIIGNEPITCGSGPLLCMAGYSSLWVGYKLFFQAMDLNVSKSGVYRIYPHGGFELITRESVK